jgi:hypothetical protein
MLESETEYVTIAVPKKHLRRMASDLSTLDPSQAEEHWTYLHQAIGAMVKPGAENSDLGKANSYRQHRSQSFSSSLASSPTLPASSRASFAWPEGCGNNDNSMDVPIMSLDLDEAADHANQGLHTSTMGLVATDASHLAPSNPPRGMKRSSYDIDEPQGHPEAPRALHLRGGVGVIPWYCPRNGDRKQLS